MRCVRITLTKHPEHPRRVSSGSFTLKGMWSRTTEGRCYEEHKRRISTSTNSQLILGIKENNLYLVIFYRCEVTHKSDKPPSNEQKFWNSTANSVSIGLFNFETSQLQSEPEVKLFVFLPPFCMFSSRNEHIWISYF